MKRHVVIVAGLAALVAGAAGPWAGTASAQTKAERGYAASRRVRAALRQELFGENGDRNALLGMALEAVPDYAPALWQSGHVRLNNRWVSLESLPALTDQDRRLTAYRIRRDQCPDTIDGHLALARWCAKQKLVDQERAHLTKVLQYDPNQAEARRMLRFRQVDGQWLSEEQIAEAAREARESAKALTLWKPRIESIRDGLDERSQAQRDAARRRLAEIDDPAAIDAMELVLAPHSELAARLVVDTLGRMTAPEASLALARLAAFAPWESVRQAAVAQLQSRDPQSYVPTLLAAMSTQIESRMVLYDAPGGRMVFRNVFFRREKDRDAVAQFDTGYRHQDPALGLSGADRRDVAEDAARRALARQAEMRRQNALIAQRNQRIMWVLAGATGQDLTTPDDWWKWWNSYNEVFVVGQRPVSRSYQRDEVVFLDPTPTGTGGGDSFGFDGSSGTPLTFECLVSGTLVWTESGPVPIERVQVGDRVLSQDPESGELTCKPVLGTTTRPPGGLVRILAGEHAIQASGGHPFWVAGRGWVKARELKPGMQLHGIGGTTEVVGVEQTGFQKTYNLIVADLHTYFVGPDKVLSHDNTIRQPTDFLVPGLAK